MMDDQSYQRPQAADTTASLSPDGDSARAVRSLFLWTTGVVLLAAWRAYDGFKHPEFRSNDLLHALLILLLGADATRKLEEAKDEFKRAFERDDAERRHIVQLEMERRR